MAISRSSTKLDTSPLGYVVAPEQAQLDLVRYSNQETARFRYRNDNALGKAGVERLLKRTRIVLNRAIATRVFGSERVS